jgi:hypothetical protein
MVETAFHEGDFAHLVTLSGPILIPRRGDSMMTGDRL